MKLTGQDYFNFFQTYLPFYLKGAGYTIALSFFSVIVGGLMGVGVAQANQSKNKIINEIAKGFIRIVRGTPLMVQLVMVYYGLYGMDIRLNDFVAGVLVISLNSSAYVAEIIRSGIQAVDKGQMEAARSLGMSESLAMRKIIYPQAFKNILPALGNEFSTLIKETSIVSVVGLRDLMFEANLVRGQTFMPFTPIFLAAVLYFILTTAASSGVNYMERRLKASD